MAATTHGSVSWEAGEPGAVALVYGSESDT